MNGKEVVGVPKIERPLDIEDGLERLNSLTDSLQSTVGLLYNRLNPALRQDPADVPKDMPVDTQMSPIGSTLREYGSRILNSTKALRDILDQLQF